MRRRRDEQLIVPRKGVLELSRLLDGDGEVQVALGANHIRVQLDGVRLTSKLIDGRFPEYSRVVPAQAEECDQGRPQSVSPGAAANGDPVEREISRRSPRARGRIAWCCRPTIRSRKRPSRRSRSSTAAMRLEIGFNVNYLLDALAAVDSEQVEFGVTDANSQLLDPRARQRRHEVRRDADAPLRGVSARGGCSLAAEPRSNHDPAVSVRGELEPPSGAATTSWAQRGREDQPARRHVRPRPGPIVSYAPDAIGSFSTAPTVSPCSARSTSTAPRGDSGVAYRAGRLEKKIDGQPADRHGAVGRAVSPCTSIDPSMHGLARGGAQRAPALPGLGSVPRGTWLPRGVEALSPRA